MGEDDAWPGIREQVMAADILVLATPTWLGQHSSVAQGVFERLDAELSEKDDEGRLMTYGKVAVAAIVGNEDGAHHITAVTYQALNDVGFTVPDELFAGYGLGLDERWRALPDLHVVAGTELPSAAGEAA